ncbi:MAG: hypothetical protein Q8828_02535 [Candidatus Phytoplasma australasiaticum]|nr:hypothetical protein [Candidatus Phytoplasma australasiaticum]
MNNTTKGNMKKGIKIGRKKIRKDIKQCNTKYKMVWTNCSKKQRKMVSKINQYSIWRINGTLSGGKIKRTKRMGDKETIWRAT